MMRTLHDLVAHVCDVADVSDNRVDVRRAIRSAVWGYQQATTRHQWGNYDTQFTAFFSAQENTGTVDVSTGGVVSRAGVWPSWSALASIYLENERAYRVKKRIDDTTLELENWTGEDLSGESYELRQDRVIIPDDVREVFDVWQEREDWSLKVVDVKTFRDYDRPRIYGGSDPVLATFRAINELGQQKVEMRISPGATREIELDVAYMRRPRKPRLFIETSGSSSEGVISLNKPLPLGTDMSNALVRGAEPDTEPTSDLEFGIQAPQHATFESDVTSISSDYKSITTSTAIPDLNPIHIVISDTLDVPEFLHNAMMLYAESQMARIGSHDIKKFSALQKEADEELRFAMEQDARYTPRSGRECIQIDRLFPMKELYITENA